MTPAITCGNIESRTFNCCNDTSIDDCVTALAPCMHIDQSIKAVVNLFQDCIYIYIYIYIYIVKNSKTQQL